MKKHVVLIITLILLFSIFIYFYLRKVDYELEYTVGDAQIMERYDKSQASYYFNVTYKDHNYELVSLDDYTNKRKLITDIAITENDTETCLDFTTSEIKLYGICSNGNDYYVANIDSQAEFKAKSSYKNINISSLDDKTYLLWNYHDFIYLNDTTQKTLTLFSNDIYNLSLIYAFDNYLLIPDYEQDYLFDKLYVINTNKARTSTIDLRFDVYFNSYFLGHDKANVYLYDLKENQEFYIDLNKEEIYTSKNQILVNGDWESISTQKFQNEKPLFHSDKNISFSLEDNKIYLSIPNGETKTLISNREISELVSTDGLNVYYIAGNILYKYNPFSGEEALLQYSEWNFNHQNMVFIF